MQKGEQHPLAALLRKCDAFPKQVKGLPDAPAGSRGAVLGLPCRPPAVGGVVQPMRSVPGLFRPAWRGCRRCRLPPLACAQPVASRAAAASPAPHGASHP